MKSDVDQSSGKTRTLPRRDLILLPLISLATVLILAGVAEIGARLAWPEQKIDSCLAIQGGLGPRGKPNCVSRTKAAEGPWVENHYNDCGLVSSGSCRKPMAGATRIAVVGSSIGFGYLIPYADTWQGRTTAALSRQCARPIDVQNYAGVYNLNESALRAPEAAAIHPQAAVMFVDPMDLYKTSLDPYDLNPAAHLAAPTPAPGATGPMAALRQALDFKTLKASSRAALIAEHYFFKGGQTYLQLYLRNGDKADFLRPPFTPVWRQRLGIFDRNIGYMADQFRAQGATLVVVYAPQQAQAEIIAGVTAPGTDPMALDNAIGEIVRRHGGVFVDAGPSFRTVGDASDYFYPVDGHMNGKAHAILAGLVEQALTAGPKPLIPDCRPAS